MRRRPPSLPHVFRGLYEKEAIDAINGTIARLGARHGIGCPVNRLLTLLIKAAEGAARAPS